MVKKKDEDEIETGEGASGVSENKGSDDGEAGQGAPVLVLKFAPSRNFPEEIREFIKEPVKITLENDNRAWLQENENNFVQLVATAKTLELLPTVEGGPLQDQANQKFNYKISEFRLRMDHSRLAQNLKNQYNTEPELTPTPKPTLTPKPQNAINPLYAKKLPANEPRPFYYLASIIDITVQEQYRLEQERRCIETLENKASKPALTLKLEPVSSRGEDGQ